MDRLFIYLRHVIYEKITIPVSNNNSISPKRKINEKIKFDFLNSGNKNDFIRQFSNS